jgi:Mevalonate pyrophosphate decarboxylase
MANKVSEIKQAMKSKDFTKFGEIVEAEAINMHAVMMTSTPPIYYWLPETLKLMQNLIEWRRQGLESYFTIDAGPNVHIICESPNSKKIKMKLREIGIEKTMTNNPSLGAKLI